MMICYMCGTELKGGLDTYGDVGEELCQRCYLHLFEDAMSDTWYGMAPIDYRGKPQADGWYEIEPGLWFWPDAEVDGGQGIWEDRGRG